MTYQNYLDSLTKANYDCVIMGIGTEDRNSIGVISKCVQSLSETVKYFMLFSKESCEEDFSGIKNCLDTKNIKFVQIRYSDYYVLTDDALSRFVGCLSGFEILTNFLLDVTGIEREHMLILVRLIKDYGHNISISYISADYGKYELSEYTQPQNLTFFEGLPQISMPIAMILLPGYEDETNKILLNWYRPSILYLGYGEPPIESGQDIPERLKIKNLIEDYTGNHALEIVQFAYDAANPVQTYKALSDVVSKNNLLPRYNLLVASGSSKLSTIGLYLICEQYPSIQFVSTVATKRKNISKGILNVYQYTIPNIGEEYENN